MQTSSIGERPILPGSPGTAPPRPALFSPLAGISGSPLTLEALLSLQLQNNNPSFWAAIQSLRENVKPGIPLSSKLFELLDSLSPLASSSQATRDPALRLRASVLSLERIGSLAIEEELRSLRTPTDPFRSSPLWHNLGLALVSPLREKTTEVFEAFKMVSTVNGTDNANTGVAILPAHHTNKLQTSRTTSSRGSRENFTPRPFRYEKEETNRNKQTRQSRSPVLKRFLEFIRSFARAFLPG